MVNMAQQGDADFFKSQNKYAVTNCVKYLGGNLQSGKIAYVGQAELSGGQKKHFPEELTSELKYED